MDDQCPEWLNFELITKSVPVDSDDKSPEADDDDTCACQSKSQRSTCTTNACLNYATLTECTKCSAWCQNNRIQKHRKADIQVLESGPKGYGLFALENIHPGQFIREYVGELVSSKELKRRYIHHVYLSVTPHIP